MDSTYRPQFARSWLSGLVLGVSAAFMLVELGVLGLAFLGVAVLVIAWKGPRAVAGAGLLTGFGLIWTVLFSRVQLTCGPGALFRDTSCFSDDLTPWILGSAGMFTAGLLVSAWALRRMRR